MIEEFMKMLLSLSFSGTCLFLLVMMIVRLARNRLSRRWQYYIWLLVVLRFLVPVTFPNTVTGQLFQNVEQAVAGRHAADSAAGGGAEDIEEIAASKAWSEEGQEDTADTGAAASRIRQREAARQFCQNRCGFKRSSPSRLRKMRHPASPAAFCFGCSSYGRSERLDC